MVEVKSKQYLYLALMDLKELVLGKLNELILLKGDGVLRYKGRLCVLDEDGLRNWILKEAHGSRYSIYLSSTKMYHDLREIYWWEGSKRDIA